MNVELLMSERGDDSSLASIGTGGVSEPQSAGALIREAREKAGLHIASLAALLKVPVAKLEALEADNWSLLPDSAFTRALAASVCRTLKLDSAQVLARLPALTQKLDLGNGGLNASFREPTAGSSRTWALRQFSRPLVLSVLALAIGAVVLILLPTVPPLPLKLTSISGETAPEPVSRAIPPAAISEPVAVNVPTSSAVEGTSGVSVAQPPAMPPAEKTSAQAPAGAPLPTASSSAPSIPSGDMVVFKATGPSWVEVSDARGTVVLRKLMQANESSSVSGVPPLAVLVGKADVTTVEVRGKPLDLQSISRNNVARFEVK